LKDTQARSGRRAGASQSHCGQKQVRARRPRRPLACSSLLSQIPSPPPLRAVCTHAPGIYLQVRKPAPPSLSSRVTHTHARCPAPSPQMRGTARACALEKRASLAARLTGHLGAPVARRTPPLAGPAPGRLEGSRECPVTTRCEAGGGRGGYGKGGGGRTRASAKKRARGESSWLPPDTYAAGPSGRAWARPPAPLSASGHANAFFCVKRKCRPGRVHPFARGGAVCATFSHSALDALTLLLPMLPLSTADPPRSSPPPPARRSPCRPEPSVA
jgi:hypothetical protein